MGEQILHDRRILIVEDEYLLASHLRSELEDAGAVVIGLAGNVRDALAMVESARSPHCAVLDINLGGESVLPVADALLARGVPFVFATGYDESAIPPRYRSAPRCGKPIDMRQLLHAIHGVAPMPA
ncbi:response regulator [Bordetella bronchialis]|nr:response regulator [Bordetella bronchialis]